MAFFPISAIFIILPGFCQAVAMMDPIIIRISEENQQYPPSLTNNVCRAEDWLINTANKTVLANETRHVIQTSGRITTVVVVQSYFDELQRIAISFNLKFNEIPKNESRILAAMQNNSVNHFILTAKVRSAFVPYKNESLLPLCSNLNWQEILNGVRCIQALTASRNKSKDLWNGITLPDGNSRCFERNNQTRPTQFNWIEVHEAYGYVTELKAVDERAQNSVNFTLKIELQWWTQFTANRFLDAIAEINSLLDEVNLDTYLALPKLTHDHTVVYFTVGKIINISVAGVVGLGILVILCSCCISLCTRSRRSFQLNVWEYVMLKKKREKLYPRNDSHKLRERKDQDKVV